MNRYVVRGPWDIHEGWPTVFVETYTAADAVLQAKYELHLRNYNDEGPEGVTITRIEAYNEKKHGPWPGDQ